MPHKVLMHMATYDCEVSNVATEIMVRSLGIAQVTPVHRSFFDIPERAAPFDDSAFVEVDPQLGFSRCNVPGGNNPGAACTTDARLSGTGRPAHPHALRLGHPAADQPAAAVQQPRPRLDRQRRHRRSRSTPSCGPTAGCEQFCAGTCDPD